MAELKIRKGTLTAEVSEIPVKRHQRRVKAKPTPNQQPRRVALDEVRERDEVDDIADQIFEDEDRAEREEVKDDQ